MTQATADSYNDVLARRIQAEGPQLAARWLERLSALLPVDAGSVFPTNELLDHIPALIHEIAEYLKAPEEEAIGAKTPVIAKAQELGVLRHRQQASVHQLLREYDILAGILDHFIAQETERLRLALPPSDCFEISRRINQAVRTLMQTTVDTFVREHTETIVQQTGRLESFNRMVSHELKNPLSTVHFAADLLTNEDFSTDRLSQARLISVVRRNTERALLLIRNLERLAQAETKLDVPTHQRIEISGLAQDIARQLRDMAAARGVEIRVAPDLPQVTTDTAQLELVLLNLVSNAIKYSDPAKPERYVEIVSAVSTDHGVNIVVRDNGLGIPGDSLPLVFQRFYRAHADRDQELGVDGTGLGLAIVQQCMKALEGSIEVESTGGEGTSFTLRLPREISVTASGS